MSHSYMRTEKMHVYLRSPKYLFLYCIALYCIALHRAVGNVSKRLHGVLLIARLLDACLAVQWTCPSCMHWSTRA